MRTYSDRFKSDAFYKGTGIYFSDSCSFAYPYYPYSYYSYGCKDAQRKNYCCKIFWFIA